VLGVTEKFEPLTGHRGIYALTSSQSAQQPPAFARAVGA
jgi:hypothetical protein